MSDGGGEHVEVRVTGPEAAVAAVLRLLRAGGPGITGGGARGPFDRNGGRVAFYAHLQVEVAPPTPTLPRCPVEVPESQRPRIVEESGVPAGEADWRCYLAPHRADRHTVRPREGGHMFPFTAEQPPSPLTLPAPRGSLAAELLVHYGARSPCKTRVCRRLPVPGLLVCCIPCRSAPDGRHGPHTEVCDRRHIESLGVEAVKAGE